jgi:dTDP-4-dehydrorhamnose 3,5-epimerase
MKNLSIKNFDIQGPILLEWDQYKDNRGIFSEIYNDHALVGSLDENFRQDNISHSKKNVIRGLHYQSKFPQGKLIFCLSGTIYDVALDIRKGSKTFGTYVGVELSSSRNQAFYVPPGFAHGFAVSKESNAIILYKCTRLYQSQYDSGISWSQSGITLPHNFIDDKNIIISDKDSMAPSLTTNLAVDV